MGIWPSGWLRLQSQGNASNTTFQAPAPRGIWRARNSELFSMTDQELFVVQCSGRGELQTGPGGICLQTQVKVNTPSKRLFLIHSLVSSRAGTTSSLFTVSSKAKPSSDTHSILKKPLRQTWIHQYTTSSIKCFWSLRSQNKQMAEPEFTCL